MLPQVGLEPTALRPIWSSLITLDSLSLTERESSIERWVAGFIEIACLCLPAVLVSFDEQLMFHKRYGDSSAL